MFDPLTASAARLLKLRAVELFPAEDRATALYRTLARRWHPDVSADERSAEVFAHVTSLFQAAQEAWRTGTYPNTLKIVKSSGPVYYPYLASMPFELGEVYIGERHVIWATRREYDDLAKRWLDTVKSYKFPNKEAESKIMPFVPRNSHTVANGDRAYTICQRPADYVRVIDILNKKGPLEPRHVAWIMSRAYNLAGFLNYARIDHFDISPETFFIEPATHQGALLGGWYYTGRPGKKALAVPARTHHLFKSNEALDAQIRLMGRRLLGATSPVQLRANKSVNEPLRAWLLGMPLSDVGLAQKNWREALKKTFGKISFTEYQLTTSEVYS